MRVGSAVLAVTTLAVTSLCVSTPHAEPLAWKGQRFTAAETVFTSAMLVGTGAFILFGSDGTPRWKGPIVGEEPVREALRADTVDGRHRAAIIGDVPYYGGLAFPFVVDVVAVAWLGRRSPDVAAQMALINTEAFALTGFLSFLSNATIRRERPYARTCDGATEPTFPSCQLGGKSEGFFSGHTAIAAAGAGLTCAHHRYLPLYGGGAGDVAACAVTIAGALFTGYTRLVADKHYLLDVVTGAALGFPIGYLIAAYHHTHPPTTPRERAWVVVPTFSAYSLGVGLSAVL